MTQSHNGEATHNRDAGKYRDNHDEVNFDEAKRPEYTGRPVPKSELKPGVRCTIKYGVTA